MNLAGQFYCPLNREILIVLAREVGPTLFIDLEYRRKLFPFRMDNFSQLFALSATSKRAAQKFNLPLNMGLVKLKVEEANKKYGPNFQNSSTARSNLKYGLNFNVLMVKKSNKCKSTHTPRNERGESRRAQSKWHTQKQSLFWAPPSPSGTAGDPSLGGRWDRPASLSDAHPLQCGPAFSWTSRLLQWTCRNLPNKISLKSSVSQDCATVCKLRRRPAI